MNPIRTVRPAAAAAALATLAAALARCLRQRGCPPRTPLPLWPAAPPPRPRRERRGRHRLAPGRQRREVDAAFASARSETSRCSSTGREAARRATGQATLSTARTSSRARRLRSVTVDGDSGCAESARFGQRLSDDGAVHAAGPGGDAPARRSRAGPLHRGAHPRNERGAAGQRGARRRPCQAGVAHGQRLAPARLLLVGHRPPAGDCQGSPAGDAARARRRRLEGRARRCDAVAPEGARRGRRQEAGGSTRRPAPPSCLPARRARAGKPTW